MKRLFGVIGIVIGLLFVLAIVYMLFAVIIDGESILGSTKTISKKVEAIYDGGNYDIVFSLEGDRHIYYINRGLQYNFKLKELRDAYTGKELEISYVSFFGTKGGHINRIKHADTIVYNELKEE